MVVVVQHNDDHNMCFTIAQAPLINVRWCR
jgi:hypothetical protein